MMRIVFILGLVLTFLSISGCTSTQQQGPYETDDLPIGSKAYDDDYKAPER